MDSDPGPTFSYTGLILKEANANPPMNMEWPSDWFIEEPRAIHQDWHLNLDSHVDNRREERQEIDLNQDSVYFGDGVVYDSSDESSGVEETIDWQQEEDPCAAELFPVPEEEDMDEVSAVEKAAMARAARSEAAKENAIRTQELKLRAAAGTPEDDFELSDHCSDDNKELFYSSDDDEAVLESEIARNKYPSKGKALKKHAVSAIYKAKEYPEDYVSDFFKKPMYKEAYKNPIYPVPGQHGWTKTDSPDIDPPKYETKRGRKQKKRRRGQHESTKSTVQQRMTTIRCSNCKLHGHRYTNCVQPLKPHLAIRKTQHKTVRKLPEDGAPPPASRHNSAPPTAPTRPVPHPPRESSVTGRTSYDNGSRLGVRGYEGSRLYSYFTPGLNYQENSQQD